MNATEQPLIMIGGRVMVNLFRPLLLLMIMHIIRTSTGASAEEMHRMHPVVLAPVSRVVVGVVVMIGMGLSMESQPEHFIPRQIRTYEPQQPHRVCVCQVNIS